MHEQIYELIIKIWNKEQMPKQLITTYIVNNKLITTNNGKVYENTMNEL